jgi:alkanesulfonate monooxygenase SsuD/methylene tetrahydromethanopterin reductase-like flavin-dependent oxidoreductase (luciferase family)
MIPLGRLKESIADFRAMAASAGRDPKSVAVKSPSTIHVTSNPDRARAIQAGTLSFYAARMGTFYAEQLTRFGFADDVRNIREAWKSGGSKAGTEAVSRRLLDEMGYVGDVAGARERLAAEAEAGADLFRVDVDGSDLASYQRTLAALVA